MARRNIIWNDDILPSAESAYHGGFFFIHKACSAAFEQCAVSAHRVRELSDLPPEPQARNSRTGCRELASRPLSLRLTNIDFRYSDDAAVKPVLTRSSFSAEPGEIIAVIGASGQGKTTLLRLILGLIRPEGGLAELVDDGGRARAGFLPNIAGQLSYVPQGNTVFSGTIAENLRIVRPEASDEELTAALDAACALRFVARMGGMGCLLHRGKGTRHKRGTGAAACHCKSNSLRDAPILLLDEATSGLDIETEQLIIRNMNCKRKQLQPQLRSKKDLHCCNSPPEHTCPLRQNLPRAGCKNNACFRRGSGKLLQRRAVTPARVYAVFV